MPSTPGYSGTPLAKKLGIKPGTHLLPVGSPREYRSWIGTLPPGAKTVARTGPSVDIVHVFTTSRADLRCVLRRLRTELRSDAATWISWPKKSSRVATDITEDVVRELALSLGFVDIKVCAVSEVWSGLKLVVRKELR